MVSCLKDAGSSDMLAQDKPEYKQFGARGHRRSTLQHFVLALLAYVLLVAFLMLATISRGRQRSDDEQSQHVQSLSDESFFVDLATTLNRSVDPCHNFRDFVCGNWAARRPDEKSVMELLRKRVVSRGRRDMGPYPFLYPQDKVTDKVLMGVLSCSAIKHYGVNNSKYVEHFLRDNGILDDYGTKKPPSPFDVMVRLSMKSMLSIAFSIQPTVDLRKKRGLVITITEGYLVNKFLEESTSVLAEATKQLKGIQRARELVTVVACLKTWKSSAAATEPAYLKIRQLTLITPHLLAERWQNAINSNLLRNVTLDTDVYITNSASVITADKVEEELHHSTTLFVIGMMIRYYFAAASSLPLLTAFQADHQRCLDYMSFLAPYAYMAHITGSHLHVDDVKKVRSITRHLLAAMGSYMPLPDKDRTAALDSIRSLLVIHGMPNQLYNYSNLNREYSYVPKFNHVPSFSMVLLNAHVGKAAALWSRYEVNLKRPVSVPESMMYLSKGGVISTVSYQPYYHVLHVPTVLLAPPVYVASSRPSSYGGLGSLFGREVALAFDWEGVYRLPNGTYNVWLSSESRKSLEDRRTCIRRLYGSRRTAAQERNLHADIVGTEVALLSARQDRHARFGDFSLLPGINNEMLFFINACYLRCTTDNSCGMQEHYCDTIMKHIPHFKVAFRCRQLNRTVGFGCI